MEADRQELVKALLSRCRKAYDDGSGDIPTFNNTIETYLDSSNQLKYVYMYFAKYVGCWRWIRNRLNFPADGPVWSIGVGPALCLMGWFFDRAPTAQQAIVGMDVAPWQYFFELGEGRALRNQIFQGAPSRQYFNPRYFPETLPPQADLPQFRATARTIRPVDLPSEATILLPMVLNHVVGANAPHPKKQMVFSWLNAVAQRVNRLVIVDMQHENRTADFWSGLWQGLGLGLPSQLYTFSFVDHAAEFRECYDGKESTRRTGLRSPQFCVLSGLVHTKGVGWRYF